MTSALQAKLARLGLVREQAVLNAPLHAQSASVLSGAECNTSAGTVWVHERRFEPGRDPLPIGTRPLTARESALLFRRPPREGASVAFDIETTGLASGAGVHVFLVGLGWWDAGSVVVRQVLMRSPSEEPALLQSVMEVLAQFTGMLSFCGRGFDIPRFRDRLALAGQTERLPVFPHDDLAPLARQMLAGRMKDTRLGSVERELLGFRRVDDLPGGECPREWFALQRGHAHRMAAVMEHNAIDVASLFGVEWALFNELHRPSTPAAAMLATVAALEAGELAHARNAAVVAAELLGSDPLEQAPRGLTKRFHSARQQLELRP